MKAENQIKKIIEELRPYLQMHDGDVTFIKYENNFVYVKLSGGCSECGMADITLKDGILSSIQEKIPEVEGIVNMTL